jgi:hypothetical protein
VPEPHCRVASRVNCHEERCTDQPELDLYPYHISNMGRVTGRECMLLKILERHVVPTLAMTRSCYFAGRWGPFMFEEENSHPAQRLLV